MLLEIGNNIVDADLSNYLKNSDPNYVPECIRVICHEVEAFEEGAFDDGEG